MRQVSLSLLLSLLVFSCCAHSQDSDDMATSPKKPWGDFTVVEEEQGFPWWAHVLLWIPNRFMDFIDIFHVDVGVGPAVGVVARISKYGQAGYRRIGAASVRVGDFGRQAPFIVEREDEYGIGPGYRSSPDRKICPAEVGLGADALLIGAYGGICIDQAIDFVAGLFFIDVLDDDVK